MRRRSQSAITPVTIRITVKSKPSLTIIDRALSALRSTWSFAARNPIAGCSRNSTTRIIAAAKMRNRQPYRSPSGPTNSPFILLMQRRLQAHQFAYVFHQRTAECDHTIVVFLLIERCACFRFRALAKIEMLAYADEISGQLS